MSGLSDSTKCPNCGEQASMYTDYKPFEHTDIACLYCGFCSIVEVSYMDLEELNYRRIEESKMKKLNKLPKQEFNWNTYMN